jgi:maleate cis-trans isomerase
MSKAVCPSANQTMAATATGSPSVRAAGAIGALEVRLERSVLTSNQVLLWSLLSQAGADFQVGGFGRLFTRKPPPRDRFD